MGIMDKAKQMREKVAESGKTGEYIDKARKKAGEMTGHRHDDTIDKGADMAEGAMRKRTDEESPGQEDHPAMDEER